MTLDAPSGHQRWRCAQCGNLTRFDVTRSRRTTEYWHFDLAGEHRVDEVEVIEQILERVRCRWCGRDDTVELVERPDAAGPTGETGSDTPS